MGESVALRILEPAQGELENIARLYLSLAGQASAKRITDRLYDALEQLERFPLSGALLRDRELAALGYRFLVVEKYIVIYRVLNSNVVVYHIFDGRSDYPALFRRELSE